MFMMDIHLSVKHFWVCGKRSAVFPGAIPDQISK